eukprot:SAG11_NODE_12979_length_676_cov_0.882149_1_plen_188_part_10
MAAAACVKVRSSASIASTAGTAGAPGPPTSSQIRKVHKGSVVVGGVAMVPLPPPQAQRQYTGELRGGRYHGAGKLIEPGRFVYDGEWAHGKRNGRGHEKTASGEEYTGAWKNDKHHGNGTWTGRDGSTYEGDFVNGVWQGQVCATIQIRAKLRKPREVNRATDRSPILKLWTQSAQFYFLDVSSRPEG